MSSFRKGLLVVGFSIALTWVFWRPLWTGGGLIGGDIYPYYLPQKAFYADRLRAGEFPLWNNLVGHGYPLVGESQTGAFYPLYLLLYRTLDVNAAYSAVHLLHYVLAFVFTWLYARRIGLSGAAASLAGVVFTYGWFPARSCLEWAIVTGAYLPLALWCLESYLQTARGGYAVALSVGLGLQLLAGHYNIAFITQLLLAVYVPLRLWFARDGLSRPVQGHRRKALLLLAGSAVLGAALAAVQIVPTWELKQNSQRAAVGGPEARQADVGYDPGYGHIPPLYLTQIVAPWYWYASEVDLDTAINAPGLMSIQSATNRVEAHLYFGMVPVLLVVWSIVRRRYRPATSRSDDGPGPDCPAGSEQKTSADRPGRLRLAGVGQQSGLSRRMVVLWSLLGAAAVVYATGWLLPITRHLPGFSYFVGPGRYGIVTALAVALLAGGALDQLAGVCRSRRLLWHAAIVALFGLTIADLYLVNGRVTYTVLLQHTPIEFRKESVVRHRLLRENASPRMLAPGPNLATLTGVAATPVYLGIGPAAYFDPGLRMPQLLNDRHSEDQHETGPPRPAPGQIQWLRRAGVTHILSFEPLAETAWSVEPVYIGPDIMLNAAWGRRAYEPLYLYRLLGGRGRVEFEADGHSMATIAEYRANRVVVEASSESGGRLVLTDLDYPGWQVEVDGRPEQAERADGMFRAVRLPPGRHTITWTYRPASVLLGAAVSGGALLLLVVLAAVGWRQRSAAQAGAKADG